MESTWFTEIRPTAIAHETLQSLTDMAAITTFHRRTGSLVALSNDNKTAQRNHPAQEFNNGVVLGEEPLKDNQLFEVKIDRKVGNTIFDTDSLSLRLSVVMSDSDAFSFSLCDSGCVTCD